MFLFKNVQIRANACAFCVHASSTAKRGIKLATATSGSGIGVENEVRIAMMYENNYWVLCPLQRPRLDTTSFQDPNKGARAAGSTRTSTHRPVRKKPIVRSRPPHVALLDEIRPRATSTGNDGQHGSHDMQQQAGSARPRRCEMDFLRNERNALQGTVRALLSEVRSGKGTKATDWTLDERELRSLRKRIGSTTPTHAVIPIRSSDFKPSSLKPVPAIDSVNSTTSGAAGNGTESTFTGSEFQKARFSLEQALSEDDDSTPTESATMYAPIASNTNSASFASIVDKIEEARAQMLVWERQQKYLEGRVEEERRQNTQLEGERSDFQALVGQLHLSNRTRAEFIEAQAKTMTELGELCAQQGARLSAVEEERERANAKVEKLLAKLGEAREWVEEWSKEKCVLESERRELSIERETYELEKQHLELQFQVFRAGQSNIASLESRVNELISNRGDLTHAQQELRAAQVALKKMKREREQLEFELEELRASILVQQEETAQKSIDNNSENHTSDADSGAAERSLMEEMNKLSEQRSMCSANLDIHAFSRA